MNIPSRKFKAALCLYLGAGALTTLLAQQPTPAPAGTAPEEPVALERFIVTGSLIPIAAGSTAVPVTTIGLPEIERTGISTDLVDILRRSRPQFYGANNLGSDVANVNSGDSNGGSGIALRNRSTLVLINGRRAVISPVLATGGNSFVDVSAIPLAAVERVEVLSDGASATYGSDAVSGVVNIILKSNFSGVEVGGSYGFSPNDGNWENRSFYAIAGATQDKTSLTVTTEWKRSDPLFQRERPYSLGLFRTPSFAGSVSIGTEFYYLNPDLNAPPMNTDLTPAQLVAQGVYQGPLAQDQVAQFFDIAAYPTLLADAERRSFTAAIEHRLAPNFRLFGDFIYARNQTEVVLNAQPVSGSVLANSPLNPFSIDVTARNRFLTFPCLYINDSTSLRAVLGFKGEFGDGWSYEAAVNWNRTNHAFRNRNVIDAPTYNALVANRTYNPFARVQAPGVVESMLGVQVRDFESNLRTLDARVVGPVFDLPGGPVQVAAGTQFAWDELDFTNDRNDQTGNWLQATPRLPFNARSNVDSFFAEARVPIFSERNSVPGAHLLELSLAGRYDIYSTTSDPTVPKYAVRWMPFNDELQLRGTYSESFVAPSLYELYGPLTTGFTSSINITRYDSSGNSLNIPTGQRQYRSQTGSNDTLEPSQSRNWTVGVVWSPRAIKGFSITADWFNIDERDLIASVPDSTIVNSVERLGTASPYASSVRRGRSVAGELRFADGTPITSPGQITDIPSDEIWISNRERNLAGYEQDGLDLTLKYDYTLPSWGRLSLTSAGTYLRNYNVQVLPDAPAVGYQDGYFARGTESQGAFPRYRLQNRIDWSHRGWSAGIGHTYIPSLDDLTSPAPYRVTNYSTYDVQIGHTFSRYGNRFLDGLQVQVGMNNVFNEYPPLIPSEGNQSHDINAYDPIGRFIYVQAKYKF